MTFLYVAAESLIGSSADMTYHITQIIVCNYASLRKRINLASAMEVFITTLTPTIWILSAVLLLFTTKTTEIRYCFMYSHLVTPPIELP